MRDYKSPTNMDIFLYLLSILNSSFYIILRLWFKKRTHITEGGVWQMLRSVTSKEGMTRLITGDRTQKDMVIVSLIHNSKCIRVTEWAH